MAIPEDLSSRDRESLIESTDVSGQTGRVVLNPDGSMIGSGGGVGQVEGDVAAEDTDSGNPVKMGGVYDATLPTYTDGDRTNLQTDENGRVLTSSTLKPLASSSYAWSVDLSSALEASSVTKASAGNLKYFSGRINATAPTGTYYLQILNASSVPADGAVTHLVTPIKLQHLNLTDTPIVIELPDNGVYASTGIVWCLSSTEFTKTISSNYVSATVIYI